MNAMDRPLVSLVVPFYNEGAGVELFYAGIVPVIDAMPEVRFEVVCVDDGSKDGTLPCLLSLVERDARFHVVELSRNFGKEAALTAGLDVANGDAAIPMDADLQDPPRLIAEMIEHWRAGYEVVLARRIDRSTELVHQAHHGVRVLSPPQQDVDHQHSRECR